MTTQKVTLRQLQQFMPAARGFLGRNPALATGKIGHCISKITKNLAKYTEPIKKMDDEMNEKVYDKRVDYAETDEKGRILYESIKDGQNNDVRQFIYTKEGHKKCNTEVNALIREYGDKKESLLDTEVEIEPAIVSEVPKGLNFMELEVFSGIVIPVGYEYPEVIDNDTPVKQLNP